jgi:putative SOS response-associated peptidase YedK
MCSRLQILPGHVERVLRALGLAWPLAETTADTARLSASSTALRAPITEGDCAPSQPLLALRASPGTRDTGGGPMLESCVLHWGRRLAGEPGRASGWLLHARAEGVVTRPTWREAAQHRRCAIPASAFLEWAEAASTATTGLGAAAPRGKIPWRFTRTDGAPFALAGLWDSPCSSGRESPRRIGTTPDMLATCVLITLAALPPVAAIHPRMPLVLSSPAAVRAWLAGAHWPAAIITRYQSACPTLRAEVLPLPSRKKTVRKTIPESRSAQSELFT